MMELRGILVGDAREFVERVAGECAEAREMREEVCVQRRLEVQGEQRREARIGAEEVGASAVGQGGNDAGRAGARDLWRRPHGQSTRAPDARTIFPHFA
jgi:hypothetical protein